jgi:hypothetical protein
MLDIADGALYEVKRGGRVAAAGDAVPAAAGSQRP